MFENSISRQYLKPVLSILLGVLLVVGQVSADSSTPATPQATIQTIVDDVLAVLKNNRDTLARHPGALTPGIARIVDPYLDFTLMSEEVLGVGWRRADAGQRARFTQAFHRLMNTDYAAVYRQYTGQRIRVTGVRWTDAAQDRAMVSSEIASPGTQPIEVDYRMHRADGRWKVYDVVVDGISLLINYRNAFAAELQQESLDGLIARIEAKIASAPAGAAH